MNQQFPSHTMTQMPSAFDGQTLTLLHRDGQQVLMFRHPETWTVTKGDAMDLHGTMAGKGILRHSHGGAFATRTATL